MIDSPVQNHAVVANPPRALPSSEQRREESAAAKRPFVDSNCSSRDSQLTHRCLQQVGVASESVLRRAKYGLNGSDGSQEAA